MAAIFEIEWQYDPIVLDSDTGSPINLFLCIVIDNTDTTVVSEVTNASGLIPETWILEQSISCVGAVRTPTDKNPHRFRFLDYAYEIYEETKSVLDNIAQEYRQDPAKFTTEKNRSIVGTYTDITFDHANPYVAAIAASNITRMYDKSHKESVDNYFFMLDRNADLLRTADGINFVTDYNVVVQGGTFDLLGKTLTITTGQFLIIQSGGNVTNGSVIGDVQVTTEADISDLSIDGDIAVNTALNSVLNWSNVPWTGAIQNDAAANTLTINGTGTTGGTVTDPGTGVGQTNLVSSVPITVEVLDAETKLPIQDARIQLYLTSDYSTSVMNAGTNASGIATTSWGGATGVGIEGWARQVDLAGTDYEPVQITGTISAGSGFSTTVLLQPSS